MYPLTEKCLNFAAGLTVSDLPPATVEQMKKYLFDLVGCGLGGSGEPGPQKILRHVTSVGGFGQASLFGQQGRLPLESAVLFNGASAHALEMDDSDREGISHPGIMVIVPALAVAEHKASDGAAFLAACVAGYEIMLRIGAAAGNAHYAIWHTTATTGVFGAAIAAGKLLGLSREGLGNAFGSAGTLAAGLWQFNHNRSASKLLHAGRLGANGLLAAQLAGEGFTGADAILEGAQGFFAAYAPEPVDVELFNDFGVRWRADGVSFKLYPCCRHTHGAIDCALALRQQLAGRSLADLASVRIETYRAAQQVAGGQDCSSPMAAKFSLAYTVAAALAHGPLTERHFAQDHLDDGQVQRLTRTAEVLVAPELEAVHPYHEGARVSLVFKEGGCLTASVADPQGDPERPLAWADLEAKFHELTEKKLRRGQCDKLLDLIRGLEHVRDMNEVLASFRMV